MIAIILLLGIMIVGMHLAYGATPRVADAPVLIAHKLHDWVIGGDEKLVCTVCGYKPGSENRGDN
jgi:hypothetical protein